MALSDKKFLDALTDGPILSSSSYWPQLEAILKSPKNQPFSFRDTGQLWARTSQWMYRNPNEAWAPETEQLFRMDFAANAADGRTRIQTKLLQTWLRFGTYTPSEEDQALIATSFEEPGALQYLQFAFNMANWASPEQRKIWLDQSHSEVRHRPTPTAESMYVYLHGDRSLLSPAQKQVANRLLCGEIEDYPINFVYAKEIARIHPEPEVWTACIMNLAWNIAKNPGPDDLWTHAYETIGNLDEMLDTMPWNKTTRENTLCLVTAVLMEREGNLLNLDMSTWQQRSPGAWEHTKSLLPILECLHNIPMGPRDSHTYMDILVSLMLVEQEKRHKSAPRDIPVDPSIFAEPTMGKS